MASIPSSVVTTTLLLVGDGGTAQAAVLCSLLGDSSRIKPNNHVLRVVALNPKDFLQTHQHQQQQQQVEPQQQNHPSPSTLSWRCYEQQQGSHTNQWMTHVGAPDVVLPITDLEQAITGIQTPDDGGHVHFIWLCCGVSERFLLLRHLAKAIYSIETNRHNGHRHDNNNHVSSQQTLKTRPQPLCLGVWGPWCGLDWLTRHAFCLEKTLDVDQWQQQQQKQQQLLTLFGFDTGLGHCHLVHQQRKSRRNHSNRHLGLVLWQSRKRRLTVTVMPSFAPVQTYCNFYLREFLSLHTDAPLQENSSSILSSLPSGLVTDYVSSLSALSVSLMDASVILIASLHYIFPDIEKLDQRSPKFHQVGLVALDMVEEVIRLLPVLFGQVLVGGSRNGGSISSESHCWSQAVITALLANALGLSSSSMASIVMEMTGNTAHDIYQRLVSSLPSGKSVLCWRSLLQSWATQAAWQEWLGLTLQSPMEEPKQRRQRQAHSEQDDDNNINNIENQDTVVGNVLLKQRLEKESCQQLMFILGLAELIGVCLPTHLPRMLEVVRQCQSRSKKMYVLPNNMSKNKGSRLVQDAPHVKDTMAPQALGLYRQTDLITFFNMSLVGENSALRLERRLQQALVLQSRL